jgi:hypothetical protein
MQEVGLNIDGQSIITPQLVDNYLAENQRAEDKDVSNLKEVALSMDLVLNEALVAFQNKVPAAKIVHKLAADLHIIRRTSTAAIWKALIPVAQKHPLSEYLLQDPFTQWSFKKPRGYSGDASLLDIMYENPAADEFVASCTDLGKEIFAYTFDAPSTVAARERREILARTVDEMGKRKDGAEILSIACGHLRESELSECLKAGTLKRWVALDQDPVSVEVVRNANKGTAVVGVEGNVAELMRRNHDLGTFDLVYASGLYDYLPRAVAVRLTQRLLELVKDGGDFFFANFSDEIVTDGYMETFMDWPLILRNEHDMIDIMKTAIGKNEFEMECFYGIHRNLVYGRIRKK